MLQTIDNPKNILSLNEAAGLADLSVSTLYKLIASGTINSYKPGGKKIYVKRDELESYLLSNPSGGTK